MRYRTRTHQDECNHIANELQQLLLHINALRDAVSAIRTNVNHMHSYDIQPDPSGEHEGLIARMDEMREMVAQTLKATATAREVDNQIKSRIERETARTRMQRIDGVL